MCLFPVIATATPHAQESNDVVMDALDILTDVLSRFGNTVAAEHARLKDVSLSYLADGTAQLRKRAMHCLAALSVHLSDALLAAAIEHLLEQLQVCGGCVDGVGTCRDRVCG